MTAPSSSQSNKSKEGYPLFIENIKHPSCAQIVQDVRQLVNQMKQRTLPRAQASKKLHDGLTALCTSCLKCEAFVGEDEVTVWEHLEKFVLLKLTNELYSIQSDRTEDERIVKWIDYIRETESFTSLKDLGLPDDVSSMLRDALLKIDLYRSPKDKIVTLLNLQDMMSARLPGVDIIEGLKSLFVEARMEQLSSNLEWIAYYRHPHRMTPEEHECLQNCCDTVQKIRIDGRLAARKLKKGPSSDDFLKELAQCQFTYDQARSLDDLACSDVTGLLEEYQQMCRTLRALEPNILELQT